MIGTALLHGVRNQLIRLASIRRFEPAEQVEKHIVLVRPDHFGDLLMLEPAVRLLQALAPSHRASLMVGSWNADVARHLFPDIDLLVYDFSGFHRGNVRASMVDPYRQIGQAAEILRKAAPQAIVLMRDDHWWGAIAAREAGLPIRIGYDHHLHNALLTHPLDVPHQHTVQQNLDVIRSTAAILGYDVGRDCAESVDLALNWPVDQPAREAISDLLRSRGIEQPFVVIHPGTGADVKRWPNARWAGAIDHFAEKRDAAIVLTGAPDESGLCEAIARQASATVYDLSGQTSLFELGELFRSASLVTGVDSGPLHLATAVGTSSLHLYGPSDPVRYGPWADPARHRTLSVDMQCPDCGNLSPNRPASCGCMTAITTEMVVAQMLDLFDGDA
jgi:ADP-heptose:LPS heptosyltransferase